MPKLDEATKIRRDKGAIAGIHRHWHAGQTVTMGDVDCTREELAERFEEHLAALELHAVGRFGREAGGRGIARKAG